MTGKRKPSYVWFICLAAGIVMGISGVLLFCGSSEDMSEYPMTEAEVREISYSVTGLRFYKQVSLRYVVDGVEYISDYSGDTSGLKEGMHISVHYAPDEPERLNPLAKGEYLLFTVAGTVLAVCGIGLKMTGRRLS